MHAFIIKAIFETKIIIMVQTNFTRLVLFIYLLYTSLTLFCVS